MNRRLKNITIAASVVYLIIIGSFIKREIVDFVYGFKQGVEMGFKYATTGEMPSLSSTGTFFLSLKPEKGLRTFPTTMLNFSDGKPMKTEIGKMVVEASDIRDRLPKGVFAADICMVLFSFFVLFVLVLIPFHTFRVIRSITKDKIFDPSNIRKMRVIGYALLSLYIADFIVNFLHFKIATYVVDVEGYGLQMDWGNIILVLLGFVVLMFAELLKVSVQLKEEQDLTV